jgi:hypothetical protein
MSDAFYVHAPKSNGSFLLNIDCNDSHIHRLGHIGVKRMKNLHSNGLLESVDLESLDTCEPCLIGKMTKNPFSGVMERVTNLLGIMHADVCGQDDHLNTQ